MKKNKYTKKELFYNDFADQWASKINNLETKKRINVIFKKLLLHKDLINKKILEIGCGMGYFSEIAFKMGAKVTGVDVGDKLVKMAKKRVPRGNFLTASASKLPFKNESFDVVLCTEVIEHVDQQSLSLREMVRVLKKEGILVITTPNRLFKPFFDFLGFLKIRPYHGNEKWIYPWNLKKYILKKQTILNDEYYFNFIYPSKFLDKIENLSLFKYLCINYAFKFKKI